MNNCIYCDKPLVPVGNKRSNGKNHNDWNERKHHKKCFKQVIESRRALEVLERYRNK